MAILATSKFSKSNLWLYSMHANQLDRVEHNSEQLHMLFHKWMSAKCKADLNYEHNIQLLPELYDTRSTY